MKMVGWWNFLSKRANTLPSTGLVLMLTLCLLLGCSNGGEGSPIRPADSFSESGQGVNRLSASFKVEASNGDHDIDDDGLIEIHSIEQLDAIRHDLNGDGAPDSSSVADAFHMAFAHTDWNAICPDACRGYELARDLDFDDSHSYA